MVHDEFTSAQIDAARAQFPGLKVVAHPECPAEVAAAADFVGSTGAMMGYVKATPAPYFLMLTECGLVGRLEVEAPEKHFIGGCRLCPYMKLNSLEKVRDALAAPRRGPDRHARRDPALARRRAALKGCSNLHPRTDHLIDLALEEDAGLGDLTSRAIFPPGHRSRAFVAARRGPRGLRPRGRRAGL